MKSFVYLHGFASSAGSGKAQYFRARLAGYGIELTIPELEQGDFEHTTLTRQLQVVERAVAGSESAVLIGSSMGGYLAALYAEQCMNVQKLVLLAPAFDLVNRWSQRLAPGELDRWQKEGRMSVYHYGLQQQRSIGYELFDDARRYPAYPQITQPALVLHGIRDDVVPLSSSEYFVAQNKNSTLCLFDSGHELTDVLPLLWTAAERFLSFSDENGPD